jgi:mycoredoxin-dependent peroxiredoxin
MRKFPIRAAAVLVVVFAGVATAAMQIRGSIPAAAVEGVPALTGQRAGGGSFNVAELRGAPAVLVFYRGAHCPLCMQRLEALGRRARAYDRLGAAVVAITMDPPDVAGNTARELGIDVPIVSVDVQVLRDWGMIGPRPGPPLPGEFVLDENGAIVFAHRGRTAADYVGDVELLGVLRLRLAGRTARR